MVDPPGSLGFDIPNFWRQEVFPVRSGRVDSHDISIGDKLIKPRSVGVYRAHEIRIPIKGGMTIPNIGSWSTLAHVEMMSLVWSHPSFRNLQRTDSLKGPRNKPEYQKTLFRSQLTERPGSVGIRSQQQFLMESKIWRILKLGGGFKHFLFSPRKLGKTNPIWRAYFSDGLKHVETTN